MKIGLVLLSTLLFASFAIAADVDGTWTGVVNVQGQETPVTWVFKADGANLTGNVTMGGGGQALPIKDGKIEGNNITFTLVVNMQGNEMALAYKGVVSAAEIKLTGEVQGFSFEYVVKKTV